MTIKKDMVRVINIMYELGLCKYYRYNHDETFPISDAVLLSMPHNAINFNCGFLNIDKSN